jgi:septal ring factor EnvC (AmiA/AmiB activator)
MRHPPAFDDALSRIGRNVAVGRPAGRRAGGGAASTAGLVLAAATVALPALVCAPSWPGSAVAQPSSTPPGPAALRDARRAAATDSEAAAAAAAAARAAEEAERRLAARRIAAARLVQDAERRLDAAEQRWRAARAAQAEAAAEARHRAAALAPLIPVMRRLALWPVETLLALPAAEPTEALQGAVVLHGIARRLRAEAQALRAAEEAAARAGRAAAAEAASLAGLRDAAVAAARALDAELAAAQERRAESLDAEARALQRAQASAARAADLAEMLARLEQEQARAGARTAARTPPAGAAATGALRQSAASVVAGRLLRRFGEPGEAGPARGLTLAAPGGARVVSPCAGRVVFGGPFRSYGQVLIVECGPGTHLVLAGLARLDVAVGARLRAGEPVGVLGGGGEDGTLYLELRRRGEPVDPSPWLAAGGRD